MTNNTLSLIVGGISLASLISFMFGFYFGFEACKNKIEQIAKEYLKSQGFNVDEE